MKLASGVYVCTCVTHMYEHTINTNTHIYMGIHENTYILICVNIYIYLYKHKPLKTHIFTCIHICT